MKRFLPFVLISGIALVGACNLFKHKSTETVVPSDGYARKYTSTPVKKPAVVKLSKGLEYTILAAGNGPAINAGDKLTMFYTGKLTNDTVFDATSKRGNTPLTFHLFKHEVIAGWDSVICHLHAGDKVIMRIPPEYGYGSRQNGKIPANSTLIFEIEVLDVTPGPKPWDVTGKDTITTPSGLKVVMVELNPTGEMPKVGSTVSVHYSGFLLNGSMFDSSVERGQPYSFLLGRQQVIKGWDEGIALLHKGEKAKLIIPYQLAYGANGRPPQIPAKATLIFDVQLVDVK